MQKRWPLSAQHRVLWRLAMAFIQERDISLRMAMEGMVRLPLQRPRNALKISTTTMARVA
jgi:hypothetical protein